MSEDEQETSIIAELKRINSKLISLITAVNVLNDRLADLANVLNMRELARKRWDKEREKQQLISIEDLQTLINNNPWLIQNPQIAALYNNIYGKKSINIKEDIKDSQSEQQ
jgi:hypothetical protein